MTIKTLPILLGEHLCIVNILLGPRTVHYREVLLYFGAICLKRCDVSICYDRSWSLLLDVDGLLDFTSVPLLLSA